MSSSPNEQVAITKITKLWGGSCTISRQSTISVRKGDKKTLAVSLAGSTSVSNKYLWPEVVSSSMAVCLYKQLGQEIENYNDILCKVSGSADGKTMTYEQDFDLDELKAIINDEQYFHRCAKQVMDKRINTLFEQLDSTAIPTSRMDKGIHRFDSLASRLIETNGPFVRDSVIGFKTIKYATKANDTMNLIYYFGVLMDKSPAKFGVNICPERGFSEHFLFGIDLYP